MTPATLIGTSPSSNVAIWNATGYTMYPIRSGQLVADMIARRRLEIVVKLVSARLFCCGVNLTLTPNFQSFQFIRCCNSLFSPVLSISECVTAIPFCFHKLSSAHVGSTMSLFYSCNVENLRCNLSSTIISQFGLVTFLNPFLVLTVAKSKYIRCFPSAAGSWMLTLGMFFLFSLSHCTCLTWWHRCTWDFPREDLCSASCCSFTSSLLTQQRRLIFG